MKKAKDKQELVAHKPKGRRPKVDVIAALRLRAQGLTYVQVGKLLNITPQGVQQAVGKNGELMDNTNGQLTAYQENEATILDAIRHKLIDAIHLKIEDVNEAKKLDLQRLVWAFGVLMDKGRLLRGQSTSNINQLAAIITAAHKQSKEVNVDAGKPKKDR